MRNGWKWVPSLYLAEGLPYVVVMTLSVILYKRMEISNTDIALYTSWLYFPWVIKPIWSPFVDLMKTKRWWICAMQLLIGACMASVAFLLPGDHFFQATLALFWLMAFSSATHDIAADGFYMIALDHGQQSFFVGIRSTFYRLSSIFGQGVLVVIAGVLEEKTGNIPMAWTLTMAVTAVMFTVITLYHTFSIPKPADDKTVAASGGETLGGEFVHAFVTFFKKPGALIAIVFMLLYRLPEAFLLKMVNPFLLSSAANGGLALSTSTVGIVYGTIGVLALTIGGIIGGMAASKWGLKKSLWPMAACMTLPCLTFVYLSMAMPHNLVIISTCVAIEQFGYGFGFTAYMLFMMYFSEGEFKTSHYAICTAFMALSMMIPGAFAGYLQEMMGYEGFFWMVIVCCLGTVAVTKLIKVDPEYGKN